MKKSSKGQLLISQPGLVDPNFRRTVVLVTEHTKEGAFGLVLNRRTRQTVADLWELLTEKRCESESVTFEGGPVQPGAVFLLHRREDFATGELPVLPGLYLGSDMDLFENLIAADEREASENGDDTKTEAKKTSDYRVLCGYAGWGPGQLDGELEEGGWIVQGASTEFIFDTSPDRLWQKTMDREGGPYKLFAEMPPNPEMN